MSDKEYPLFPALTEQGAQEAQRIMDSFKPKIINMMEEILGDLYTDVSYYVESDHWTNYRNALMDGIKNYGAGKPNHAYDYKEIRKAIYENHKDEIVADLNQDLVEENHELRERIREMQESIANRL